MSKQDLKVGDFISMVGPNSDEGHYQNATGVLLPIGKIVIVHVQDDKDPENPFIKIGTWLNIDDGSFQNLDELFGECEILTIDGTPHEVWWEYIPD